MNSKFVILAGVLLSLPSFGADLAKQFGYQEFEEPTQHQIVSIECSVQDVFINKVEHTTSQPDAGSASIMGACSLDQAQKLTLVFDTSKDYETLELQEFSKDVDGGHIYSFSNILSLGSGLAQPQEKNSFSLESSTFVGQSTYPVANSAGFQNSSALEKMTLTDLKDGTFQFTSEYTITGLKDGKTAKVQSLKKKIIFK